MVKALARLYHQLGQADDAREVLHEQVHSYPDAVDLTHVNILAELYMEALDWKLAVEVIQHAKHELCGQADLPIELQVYNPGVSNILYIPDFVYNAYIPCTPSAYMTVMSNAAWQTSV